MKKWTADHWLYLGIAILFAPLVLMFFLLMLNGLLYMFLGYSVFHFSL